MKTKFCIASALALALASTATAGKLEDVQAAGELGCGVSEGVPGFSSPNSEGQWAGFVVDICKAVAAAVLGDAGKVRYVPLASKQKVLAVTSGQVDITSRTTTWTMSRDAKEGADFTGTVFYDGQGFMVRAEAGVENANELNGASICVTSGTTTELNLADFGRANSVEFEAVVFEGKKEAFAAYESGRCDAISTDASQLAAFRTAMPDVSLHKVLPQIISKEPLSQLVAQGDAQWKDIVTWVVFGLINAEEAGITSANAAELTASSEDPNVQRLLGVSGEMGGALGLDNDWLKRAIESVGNYGEIFDRNLGGPLSMDRNLNKLWTKGGILYAPPVR